MPAPGSLSNWSLYRLIEVSSVNYLFVIDTIKYLYTELSAFCPDDCKQEKLQEFYQQFSTLNSIHTCGSFEHVKEQSFNWFTKISFVKTCNSPSKRDVFQLCQKANNGFRILLKELTEQYSCLNLENNYQGVTRLSLLCSFHSHMLELQKKTEFNIDEEMMSPFTWSAIHQFISRTLHPVGTTEEATLVSKVQQKLQHAQPLSTDQTNIKNKKTRNRQCNVKQPLKNTSLIPEIELSINSPSVSLSPKMILNNEAINKHRMVLKKISKSKKVIQQEIDQFVSKVCTENKSMLLEINEKQMNNESQNLGTPSTHEDNGRVNSESDEDILVEIKKYESLIENTSKIITEKDMKIELLENNINKCRNKCRRLHKNLTCVKRLHLKQKDVASHFL